MKLHITSNGRGRKLGYIRSVLDFFFPYPGIDKEGVGIIRCEASTWGDSKGNGEHHFYTFRAFFLHCLYTFLINPIKQMLFSWQISQLQPRLGAIAYDNSTGAETAGTTTITHTAAGTNRLAIINTNSGHEFGGNNNDGDATIQLTYDGFNIYGLDSLPHGRVAGIHVPQNSFQSMCYYVAPPTGAKDIVYEEFINFYTILTVITYSGCDQTSAVIDSHNIASQGFPDPKANSFTISTTVVTLGCWLTSGNRNDTGATVSISGAGVLRTDELGGGPSLDSNGTVGTGSQSLAVTWGGVPANVGGVIASIAPFSGSNRKLKGHGITR